MQTTKNIPFSKWLLLGLFAFVLSFSANAQITGINIEPLCWRTAGGVDSTIYVAWQNSPNTTKPARLHYFNVAGLAVNVSGGSLSDGPCSSPEGDTIINQLDVIINLLGGNADTCMILNKSTVQLITTTTTYSANARNSIAILPISGTVTLSIDGGAAATLPIGATVVYNGRACRYLESAYTINIASGSVLVTSIY